MSYDVYWVKNRAEKIADFEHPTLQDTAQLHMAQCISHMIQPSPIAPPRFRVAGPTIRNPLQAAKQRRCGSSNPHTPQVPRRGTDHLKPTASCEAAQLWV